MSATRGPEPRQRLLDGTVEYLARHGTAGMSLRQLATALGTSHRMLLYHFGSKEALLVEVARAVEQQQRDQFRLLGIRPDAEPGVVMRDMYRRLVDPATWPYMRLFFDLYARGLQGDEVAARLLDGVVTLWVEPLARFIRAQGVPEADARADARIALATARGLALDLLATGNRSGIDEAAERFISGLEQRWRAERPKGQKLTAGRSSLPP
ncbi:MAG: TetR/AcrR family transcriptional regulator [Actinocatenispora sp.]